MNAANRRIRLVVHVGVGKTGTTALQHFFNSNRNQLLENGILNCGIAFEQCDFLSAEQTKSLGGPLFLSRPTASFSKPLENLLSQVVSHCEEKDIGTILWSNESLFLASDKIASAFKSVADRVDLTIVVYLRRQDRWAVSGFKQWGIKHKTYEGPVVSFGNWFKPELCNYLPPLKKWRETFPKANLVVRIYERCAKDIVGDFSKATNLDLGNTSEVQDRIYETPGDVALHLYKIYNSQFNERKLPELENLLKRSGVAQRRFVATPFDLGLPTAAELKAILEKFEQDNRQLADFSTPDYAVKFDDAAVDAPAFEPLDQSKTIAALLMMLMGMEKRINVLKRQVDLLSEGKSPPTKVGRPKS